MRRLLITALLLSPLTCAAGTIYKCLAPDGRVSFSDTGCPDDDDRRAMPIYREAAHRTLEQEVIVAPDDRGDTRYQHGVVLPDPDARSGLRAGEKRMLNKIERDEQAERIEKQHERRTFLREHDSYGERVERRNREIRRRNDWERDRR